MATVNILLTLNIRTEFERTLLVSKSLKKNEKKKLKMSIIPLNFYILTTNQYNCTQMDIYKTTN